MTRDRSFFIERYLSQIIIAEVERVQSDDRQPDPWAERCPYRPVGFPTKWNIDGVPQIFPAETAMIPVHNSPRHRQSEVTDVIIEGFSDIANGWSKPDLRAMQQLLCGTPVILEGSLRIMPALPGDSRWARSDVSPFSVHTLLSQSEDHARAGRIPLLKDSTKRALVERNFQGGRGSPWEAVSWKLTR